MSINPFDAWVLRRLLVGHSLNGELKSVSEPFRELVDRLATLPAVDRQIGRIDRHAVQIESAGEDAVAGTIRTRPGDQEAAVEIDGDRSVGLAAGRGVIHHKRTAERRANREAATGIETPECWFDASAEERERNQLIQEAMQHLPDIYRAVITLKVWGGLTFEQIADVSGCSASSAFRRYEAGIAALRESLGVSCPSDPIP